jgi:hypothetical protein
MNGGFMTGNGTLHLSSSDVDRLKQLSTTEILAGVMLFLNERTKFPEQAVYKLFREIGDNDEELSRRFRVFGAEDDLRSQPLRQILDHMEIGKTLDFPPPNPVQQFYLLRTIQKDAVAEDLKERGVLPDREQELKTLSERFSKIVAEIAEELRLQKA